MFLLKAWQALLPGFPFLPAPKMFIFAENYSMAEQKRKQKFIKLPQYTGGKKALNEFLGAEINYPPAALEARVEGTVIIAYEIDDNGVVHKPFVIKGIGYGCDEEAVRVVSLLQYEKVKNMGFRVRTTRKTSIHFKLPEQTTLQYSVKAAEMKSSKQAETVEKTPEVYTYTISF